MRSLHKIHCGQSNKNVKSPTRVLLNLIFPNSLANDGLGLFIVGRKC